MNDAAAIPPQIEFKDRSTGLTVFGILEIILGCLCGALVPLIFFAQAMSAQVTGGPPNYRMAVPGAIMYGILAVAFIWLGIGSIKCRRWARTLVLVLSWSWLVIGVISFGFFLLLLPKVMADLPAGPGKIIGLFFTVGLLTVILIVVPGVLVLFYQSKDVKATCETRDGVSRWTDACPLPVLALCLWLSIGAVTMLAMLLAYNGVLPFFGILLSGLPGTLLYMILAALWSYLAWASYRLRPIAWRITLVMFLLMAVSNTVTFARVDLIDMYRLMGYPQQQIAEMQKYDFLTGKTMVWGSAFFFLPIVDYLLWMKRFFRRTA